jgi:hypothetical protein
MGRMNTRNLWLLAIAGIVLTGVLSGIILVLAGSTLRSALLVGAFVVSIEGIYYGMAAAFSIMRRSIRMQEHEALAARIERSKERIKQRGEKIKANICPYCDQPMTRIQRGSHVVAMPCGHTLYTGKL